MSALDESLGEEEVVATPPTIISGSYLNCSLSIDQSYDCFIMLDDYDPLLSEVHIDQEISVEILGIPLSSESISIEGGGIFFSIEKETELISIMNDYEDIDQNEIVVKTTDVNSETTRFVDIKALPNIVNNEIVDSDSDTFLEHHLEPGENFKNESLKLNDKKSKVRKKDKSKIRKKDKSKVRKKDKSKIRKKDKSKIRKKDKSKIRKKDKSKIRKKDKSKVNKKNKVKRKNNKKFKNRRISNKPLQL